MSKGDYDMTFSDFLDEAQELAESWNNKEPEDSMNERSKAFVKKYAKFIVPVVIVWVMFTAILICMIGFCCCSAASCCADGI